MFAAMVGVPDRNTFATVRLTAIKRSVAMAVAAREKMPQNVLRTVHDKTLARRYLLTSSEKKRPLATVTDLPPPGTVLGKYRLLEVIADGGMGRVYLAEHTSLGRKVALKMLHPRQVANPRALKRFFGEAHAVNRVGHENLIEITDFVEKEGSHKHYIMELLKGQSLASLLEQEKHLPQSRYLPIMSQVAEAMGAVHEENIVHRDITPDNIFLTTRAQRHDFVKILDFGVAKIIEGNEELSIAEEGKTLVGTPAYMSPEQASSRAVDYLSDIYSLGVVLYQLATGRVPFEAQDIPDLIIKQVTISPEAPSALEGLSEEVAPELEQLIMECLEKDPHERPQSMQEVYVRLQMVIQSQATEEQAPVEEEVIVPKKRSTAYLVGSLIAVVMIIGGIWLFSGQATDNPKTVRLKEPVLPQTVKADTFEVVFDSQPQGAEVYRAGSDVLFGKTPFSTTMPVGQDDKDKKIETFEFRLAGYQAVTHKALLAKDTKVFVTLQALPPEPKKKILKKKRKRRKKRKTTQTKKTTEPGSGGFIDPFAE
jgi:serine/threonine-protein kinase